MMNKNTMTHVEALAFAIENLSHLEGEKAEMALEKLNALRDQTATRNARKSDKPTKSALEAQAKRDAVLAFLRERGAENPASISEIVEGTGFTPNQITSAVTKLGENAKGEGMHLIDRAVVKGKPFFSIKVE